MAVQQVQQRVQILRGPDGKLQVRGLMPGQQLVQMPDGKLHVLNTGQAIAASPAQQTSGTSTNVVTTPTTTKIATTTKILPTPSKTPVKTIAIKPNQNIQSTPTVQRIKTTTSNATTTTPQKNTLVVANTGQQIVQEQVLTTPNQVIVNNANLAQQLASGKAQLASIGGHQVVIRSTPTGNQIVQLNSANSGIIVKTAATPNKTLATSTAPSTTLPQQILQSPPTPTATTTAAPAETVNSTTTTATPTTATPTTPVTTTPVTAATPATPAPGSVEASLLAGQPPGTIIKCVTAQVIQTTQGPRIVLQGLQGADFTPQQLAMVQQQVKQQLLKGKID